MNFCEHLRYVLIIIVRYKAGRRGAKEGDVVATTPLAFLLGRRRER